ncbi:MAG: VacJ family lipoprotein [Thioalkalivibrio sp.]|nr:VacJ family lipoprotein [Thioalkalivibrio sp.]
MSVIAYWRTAVAAPALLILAGCATIPAEDRHPDDPWESYNRAVFEFNESLDEAVLRPAAVQYRRLPQPVRTGVGNFFAYLDDFTVLVNNLLQGKLHNAASDTSRIMFNTSFGLFGLIDVASLMGLDKNNEDFGQTLGRWGVGSGPYFQIPVLGPSTVRDAPARLVDARLNPLNHSTLRDDRQELWFGLRVVELIDTRAGLIATEDMLEQISDDPYIAMRQAYLQRRDFLVRDGEPDGADADAMLDELEALEALEAMEPGETAD